MAPHLKSCSFSFQLHVFFWRLQKQTNSQCVEIQCRQVEVCLIEECVSQLQRAGEDHHSGAAMGNNESSLTSHMFVCTITLKKKDLSHKVTNRWNTL